MKFSKLFLLFPLLVITGFKLQAQIEAGSRFTAVDVALKLGLVKDDDPSFDGNIFLQKGKFISSNFLLGGDLGLAFASGSVDGTFKGTLGMFDRIYLSSSSNMCPYLETGFDLGGAAGDEEGFLFRVKAGPGISFRVGENVLMDAKFRYVLDKVKDYYGTHSLQFTVGIGLLKQ